MNKFDILQVLEDGSFLDTREVKGRLLRLFGLDCKIDSLRKDLLGLRRQGVLTRKKMKWHGRRCYHYRIRGKGRQWLAIFRARKKQKREAPTDLQRQRYSLRKEEEGRLFDRWIDVVSSMTLCDAVLSHSCER